MKKSIILFAAAVLALSTTINAENLGRGYGRYGGSSSDNPFTVGLGYAMLHESISGGGLTISSNLHGAYLGGAYNVSLSGDFGFEPGLTLFFATKSETDEYNEKKSVTMIDAVIPLNFTYGLDLGGAKLTFLAGPAINLGLVANNKYTIAGNTTSTSAYEGNNARKRFNLYVGAGARLAFGQFGINLSYNLGLLNVYDMGNTDASYKDNRLTAGVSYSF